MSEAYLLYGNNIHLTSSPTIYGTSAIGKEEEEDKAARIQAQQLLSQRNSVAQRIQEAQAELEALQASLEKKQADKQDRATRLQRQVSRNGPELALFGRMLGCYIRAVPGQAKLLEFKFNLVNPDDPAEEARFVLDVDLRNYRGELIPASTEIL